MARDKKGARYVAGTAEPNRAEPVQPIQPRPVDVIPPLPTPEFKFDTAKNRVKITVPSENGTTTYEGDIPTLPVTLRRFQCHNLHCAVESYTGADLVPLNHCPNCQTLGARIG